MKTNYLTRHWRGDLSLTKAIWLTGLLGLPVAIVLWALQGGMTALAATTQEVYEQELYYAIAILIFPAGVIPFLMWWAVGALRSARNSKGKKFLVNLARAWILFGLAASSWDYLSAAAFSFSELSKGHIVVAPVDVKEQADDEMNNQEAQEAAAETTPTPSPAYPKENIGGPIPSPYPTTQQSLPSEVAGGQTVHMIGIRVTLPVGQSGETLALRDYVSVSVDRNGNPYFDKTEMGYDQLSATLKKVHDENPEVEVFIRGDADTVHGNIIRVLDILRSVGFYKVAFEIKSEAAKALPAPKSSETIAFTGIPVALPSAVAPLTSKTKDYVAIQVREWNTVYFDDQYVADDEILPRLYRLHEANPNIKVSISATMLALHGDVITVLDKARRARIEKVDYQIRAAQLQGKPKALRRGNTFSWNGVTYTLTPPLAGENFMQYAHRLHLPGVPGDYAMEIEPNLPLIAPDPFQNPTSNTPGFDPEKDKKLGKNGYVRVFRRGVFVGYRTYADFSLKYQLQLRQHQY